MDGENPASGWIRMYRTGMTGAGISRACDAEDILEVLNVLADAKRCDLSLESEHLANRRALLLDAGEPSAHWYSEPTPAWQRRIGELTAYVTDHGRMPRQSGGDETETPLGRWLDAQRAKAAKGTLGPRQRASLDAVGSWDSPTRKQREEAKFPARLRTLAAFRARHRRFPSYRQRTDPAERALGAWLHMLRQAAGDGRLPDNLRKALDQTAAGWNS